MYAKREIKNRRILYKSKLQKENQNKKQKLEKFVGKSEFHVDCTLQKHNNENLTNSYARNKNKCCSHHAKEKI